MGTGWEARALSFPAGPAPCRAGPRLDTPPMPSRFPIFALLVLLMTATAPAATVTLLDGSQAQGATLTFADPGTLDLAGRRIALADCDSLILGSDLATSPASPGALLLADGSWVPFSTLRPAAGADAVRAETTLGILDLPLGVVSGWGPVEWLARSGDGTHDRLQLANEELTGAVQGLADGRLSFLPDLAGAKPISLPLDAVPGLRLAQKVKPPKGLHLAARLMAQAPSALFLATADGVRLAAAPKIPLTTPPGQLLTVRGGRRVYLGDLAPATVEEQGAFGVTWKHAVDTNLDGSPLVLGGVRHERGLVLHSRARLAWDLGGRFLRLRARLGISDLLGNEGDCAIVISADGKPLLERPRVRGGRPPESVDLDLTGVKRLEILVDFGERFDIGDHLALADAYLVRAP